MLRTKRRCGEPHDPPSISRSSAGQHMSSPAAYGQSCSTSRLSRELACCDIQSNKPVLVLTYMNDPRGSSIPSNVATWNESLPQQFSTCSWIVIAKREDSEAIGTESSGSIPPSPCLGASTGHGNSTQELVPPRNGKARHEQS